MLTKPVLQKILGGLLQSEGKIKHTGKDTRNKQSQSSKLKES